MVITTTAIEAASATAAAATGEVARSLRLSKTGTDLDAAHV
jgi:hypothetical protein